MVVLSSKRIYSATGTRLWQLSVASLGAIASHHPLLGSPDIILTVKLHH